MDFRSKWVDLIQFHKIRNKGTIYVCRVWSKESEIGGQGWCDKHRRKWVKIEKHEPRASTQDEARAVGVVALLLMLGVVSGDHWPLSSPVSNLISFLIGGSMRCDQDELWIFNNHSVTHIQVARTRRPHSPHQSPPLYLIPLFPAYSPHQYHITYVYGIHMFYLLSLNNTVFLFSLKANNTIRQSRQIQKTIAATTSFQLSIATWQKKNRRHSAPRPTPLLIRSYAFLRC